ncbi:unnamed protein product [Adineta steineri]|uniref:Uncharacterized protein n=1 Tax=Adineta steineri TaxID=433720 RepID=A0A816G290_9BILA|nr:unnamed protein product [Adineta steineri]CAF1669413.1 unnamed protein product [Adineta steineri]
MYLDPAKEVTILQQNEKQMNKGFVPLARGRSQSTRLNHEKSQCLCMNCNNSYSTLFQTINNVDLIKNVLPCDENDDCRNPLNIFFTYSTDVNSKRHQYNTTTTCTNCYTNIVIDSVRGAWDYTLTLESPQSLNRCPAQHVAHCGGEMSRITWYITGGLSGLFLVIGVILCSIKLCRSSKNQIKPKKKKMEVPVINA